MPQIDVRPLSEENQAAYSDVISRTYNDGLPIDPERHHRFGVERYVADIDGTVVGGYTILKFKVAVGQAVAKCAGIAGVAVAPEIRKSGVGSALMRECVQSCYKKGVPFASLYAFREPFYRKAGFEVVGKRLRINVPSHRIPKVDAELPIRVLRPSDHELLQPAYSAFAHARAGAVIRDAVQWSRVLAENKELVIYAAGDPVEAYAVVNHDASFWVNQHISEFVWSTRRGYRSIISAISGIGINKTSLSWYEPSDSPFMTELMDQGAAIAVERHVMYRVCDVKAALELLQPVGTGQATISVSDEVIPENDGTWIVNWSDGKTIASKIRGEGVRLTVQQLVQVILGEPSYADLARNGAVASEPALHQLFEARPVCCLDFF